MARVGEPAWMFFGRACRDKEWHLRQQQRQPEPPAVASTPLTQPGAHNTQAAGHLLCVSFWRKWEGRSWEPLRAFSSLLKGCNLDSNIEQSGGRRRSSKEEEVMTCLFKGLKNTNKPNEVSVNAAACSSCRGRCDMHLWEGCFSSSWPMHNHLKPMDNHSYKNNVGKPCLFVHISGAQTATVNTAQSIDTKLLLFIYFRNSRCNKFNSLILLEKGQQNFVLKTITTFMLLILTGCFDCINVKTCN